MGFLVWMVMKMEEREEEEEEKGERERRGWASGCAWLRARTSIRAGVYR